MICKIDLSTEEGKKTLKDIRIMVAGDLNDMAMDPEKPKFVLEEYLKSIYDFIYENTEGDKDTKHAMALSYAGVSADALNKIQGADDIIGNYLYEQKVDLNKIREISFLYKNPTQESLAELSNKLGVVEITPEDLEEMSKASRSASQDTELNNTLGGTNLNQKDLPPTDLGSISYKKSSVFTAAKPTVNSDQDQEVLFWQYPDHPLHNTIDTTKVFYFNVKKFLLSKVFSPGMNKDSSNIVIPYSGKKGVYLTLMPIKSLPKDQITKDVGGLAEQNNDLVLVVTDADGVPVRFAQDGTFDKDGNISYHYYRMIYPQQVDANGVVYLNKRGDNSAAGTIDDYDRAKALARRNPKKNKEEALREAENAIREQLQMIYDINQAYKKNPDLKLRSKINGGSFGLLETDSKLYTPIANIAFEVGEFNPKVSTMTNTITGERQGYTYFETRQTGNIKIEVVKFPVTKAEGLQDKLISLMLDDLEYITINGISEKMSSGKREAFIKKYLYLRSSGVQVFGDSGVLKVRIRGEEIYKSLPLTPDFQATPEALEQDKINKEEARKKLVEYFTSLSPQSQINPSELSQEEKDNAIEGTDPFDPEIYPKFKEYSIFLNTETGEYWRMTKPSVSLDKATVDANNFYDVDVETINGEKKFVEKEKSFVDFIKENGYVHHPLNANNKITAFNAYYTFDYLESDLEKVFKKPEVDTKSALPQSTPTSKGPSDTNTLGGLNSILDDPRFNKVMDQKTVDVKATEEQLKAVLPWWESSPLSKTGVKLDVLFDMINTKNPKAIANMSLHALTLYKGADYSDLYHEAWHYFTQAFMTQEQRDALYAEAGKMKGSFTDYKGKTVLFKDANPKQLEEYLAEDFRAYMLSGGKKAITNAPVKKSLFQKILDFLKALFGDESFSVIDADNNSIRSIYDIYEKLRLGNLNEYNFSTKNYQWSSLDKGITAFDENESVYNLSYEDSKYVVDTVDSLLSKFVDDFSNIKRNRGLDSYKWTKTLLQNPDGLKAGYQQVVIDLSNIRNGMKLKSNAFGSKIAELSKEEATPFELEKAKLDNKINLIDWTIKNFGDTDNLMNNRPGKNEAPKGVIAYHQQKSKILAQEYKEAFFAEDAVKEEDLFLKGRDGFDRGGNENSVKDMASEEILFILHGLHKTDIAGNYIYEEGTEVEVEVGGVKRVMGIPQLQDFDVSWNVLVKTLQNTLSLEKMVQKLVALKERRQDLPIAQLLNKMGPLNTKGKDEFNIWTNFFQTFNKTNIPLLQTTVELTSKYVNYGDEKIKFENLGYTIKAVPATGDINAIKSLWDSNFQTLSKPNRYINKNAYGVNYLNIKNVLKDFPKDELAGKEIQFLNAIGIQLDDNEDIRESLHEIVKPVNALYKVLEKLSLNEHYKETITKPSILAKNIPVLDEAGNPKMETLANGKQKPIEFFGENKNLNIIADIQAKYSEKWGNFQRTNAEGNTQHEHSLNNSLSIMVNALNSATSYRELISAPWMKHLDIRRNPNAKASWWLRSMFDIDDFNNGGPGEKRKDNTTKSGYVEMHLKNLSGVALNKDGVYDKDKATASASADATTKLLMDFHMVLVNGASELMRHADKGTSYGIFLSSHKRPDVIDKNYTNPLSYLLQQGQFTEGELDAYKYSIMPSLNAEVTRIKSFRSIQDQIDKAKKEGKPNPIKNFDFTYLDRGQSFVTFQGMLEPATKIKLIKEVSAFNGDMLEYFKTPEGKDLESQVRNDLSQYFKKEKARVTAMIVKANKKGKRSSLIADNVLDSIRSAAEKNSDTKEKSKNDSALKQALVSAYVFNSWIHNIESINLIYGDLPQYKLEKEEFHKRNAGVTSTGDIYRTDDAAIDYVNNVLGRGYLQEKGFEDKYGPFNGTMNTAIIKDNEIRSVYFKQYAEALIDDIISRSNGKVSRKEAEKTILGFDKKTGELGTVQKPFKNGKLFAYQKMNEGDAQGWITIDSYRILINLEGKWSDKQEALYQKIVKGEKVSEKDIYETFPPQKLQYWGPLNTEGMPITAFHKFSLMPLVPSVIKDTNLKNLHDKMVSEGIDYAVFNSGSKVGNITKDGEFDKLYSDDNRTISSEPFTKNSIFLNYLKNQLNIAPKFKEKVTFSTQLRKLIIGGLIERGVPTDYKGTKEEWDALKTEDAKKAASDNYKLYKQYEDNLKALTELKKQELLDEMNWTMVDGEPQGDLENLVKFVRAELTRQDLAEHEIDFVDLVEGGKKLKHDLSMSTSASKIEKVLNSIVTNRLIKQKINGEALIQISGAGFESLDSLTRFSKASAEDIEKYKGTNDLPTYYKGKNGKTVAMKVKVAMQGKFKNLLKSKDVLDRAKEKSITPLQALNELVREDAWLNKGENRKMVTMVGVRIPVQGINSAEFMEVYEFLPEEAGNIIIPPAEIVAKSGSDFDIDKLTVIMPNIGQYGDNVKLVKYNPANVKFKKQLKEELQELYAMRTSTKEMYDEWFLEDKENKVFKTLTEEEQAIIQKLKDVVGSKLNEVNDKLKELKKTRANKLSGYNDKTGKRNKEAGKAFFLSNEYTQLENEILELTEEKERIYNDFDTYSDFFNSTFYKNKIKAFREKEQQDIDNINKQIAEVKEKLDSASSKGLENDLLNNIKEMLELPQNYVTLITPNGTDTAQPLADELGPLVNDYNTKTILNNKPTEKENEFLKENLDNIQGTRALEVGYNLYKHTSNNVGKAVLGIGAVDNTMNSILNRVGAYLNPQARVWNSKRTKSHIARQTILTDHNTMMVDGQKVISLSDLYDVNKENSIGDLISQLMNGWVDVAKEAWIFNIQGNKEITPTLLFMIQAGVPFETAVYMVSQPIIREYVEEQRSGNSSFSSVMGIESKSRSLSKFDAKKRILQKYYPEYFTLSEEDEQEILNEGGFQKLEMTRNAQFSKSRIYEFTVNETNEAFKDDNGKMKLDILKDNVESYSKDPNREASQYEKAVFLHFLELEDMANAIRDIKMSMNFDTNRDSNIFEAQNRTALIARVRDNDRLPTEIVDKILNDSPISSFYISKFQTKIWEPLFKLRNKEQFVEFIQDKMKTNEFFTDVEDTFDDKEAFINNFRNDLISTIFQETLKSFSIQNLKSYKGFEVVDGDVPSSVLNNIQDVSSLGIGVFFVGDKVYLDKKSLVLQYMRSDYAKQTYNNFGLANVDLGIFGKNGFNEYFHFVFEREYLRQVYGSTSSLKGNPEFDAIYQETLENTPRIITDLPTTQVRVINDADLGTFNNTVKDGKKLPKEWFTNTSSFKEFYNPSTGKREKAPQNSKWVLNKYDLYDLWNTETGELYISNVNLQTGMRIIPTKPGQSFTSTQPSTSVKVISEDYGVVQAETNPTKADTQEVINLIAPQIEKQAYKENVGVNANWQFSFGNMWSRVNLKAKPLLINSFAGVNKVKSLIEELKKTGKVVDKSKYIYDYHELDQDGNPLPPISDLQPLIDKIQTALGIDMSGYDSVLGNIYLDEQSIAPHRDTTEAKSAEGYPVIVYTIGNDSGLGIWDDNKGKMTFQGAYKEDYQGRKPTNEILTKDGTIYTFGMDGKGRFNLSHTTPLGNVKKNPFPAIKLSDGRTLTNYTVTLTFRRAADLTPGMPKTPAKLGTQPQAPITQKIYSKLGNKTQSDNVLIKPWSELKDATKAISNFNNQVISTRIKNSNEHFGNPFSHEPAGKAQGLIKTETIQEAVEKYIDWVINSKDERAQWIRNQLESGELKGKPILYYKELGEPSHATALDYLINKYDWSQPAAPATQEEETDYDITKIKEEESVEDYKRRVNATAFEEFIKDKALTNIYNTTALFKGNKTYADKLNMIKTKFAEENLIERYPVLKVLGVDSTVVDKINRYANIKLVANLNDTEELNSFYEQMLDLQNPTVKKVEDPQANKFISEYFTNLTMVAFLQSGLNTNSKFSITRLMPQDSYVRLMEKPIKDKIANLPKSYLDKYYKMFVEQNNSSRYKLRDRFKDYVQNDIEIKYGRFLPEEELQSTIRTQTSGARFIKKGVVAKSEDAEKLMVENPDMVFMYRDALTSKQTFIAGPDDLFFRNQPLPNKLGIPDRLSSYLTVKDLVKDVNGGPNPDIVKAIDEMVETLEKSGKTPVFYENGYGQEWIGIVPEDITNPSVKNEMLKQTAPETFLYLSKVLFEKFGFVNKNYDSKTQGKAVIQAKQPITDEMVLEFMRKCYI